jgi:hypothetical protein
MNYTFKPYSTSKGFEVQDEEGTFALITPNLITNIWEYTEVEDSMYHTIEELESIVKFMKENCKS